MGSKRRNLIYSQRTKLDVESKGDESPVTIADKAAEVKMRAMINEAFPDHGVYGEEGGLDFRKGQYVWVLDPIDGTKSFITGTEKNMMLPRIVSRGWLTN